MQNIIKILLVDTFIDLVRKKIKDHLWNSNIVMNELNNIRIINYRLGLRSPMILLSGFSNDYITQTNLSSISFNTRATFLQNYTLIPLL